MFSYGSRAGPWGLSSLAHAFAQSGDCWLCHEYDVHGKTILLLLICLATVGMNYGTNRLPLFAQCGFITTLLLFLTPGFGLQYLVWAVPWLVWLPPMLAMIFQLTAGALFFTVYTHWSRGLPLYFADSLEVPGWGAQGAYLGLICWLLTGIVALRFANEWFLNRT